jgi:hypothetical protein
MICALVADLYQTAREKIAAWLGGPTTVIQGSSDSRSLASSADDRENADHF